MLDYSNDFSVFIHKMNISMDIEQEKKQIYTFEEYLAFEEAAEVKHEYHNGYLEAMAGGTGEHSILCNNIGSELHTELKKSGKKCITFNSDMKTWIPVCKKSLYPDALVVCGEPKYTDENRTVLENPMLIIEVLSKSSRFYDKGEKFECYRSLPSFREYMIVYQTIPRVETWYKEEEELWRIKSATGLDKTIYLHTLDATIALKDIYLNIDNLNFDEEIVINQVY